MVSYTNAGGAQQIETDVTLPWSKSVTVAGSGITPVGLLATSMTTGFGAPGQAVSGKIIVGSSTKANATVNTTAQGYMSFGPLHHNLGQ
ncbi:hypothetical protein MKQ70_12220 [Chitinophaga sedimenti]|uniref:hypothetical protein n=1 Tax=Chitinophaga sedimenti TaxID=2033606 RepID=UPI002006CF5D|nr:hypothetical protein [Chitinophaga sedimenti]MCK7555741.1 hypothetical protein [Chitinophaga sedimenti]